MHKLNVFQLDNTICSSALCISVLSNPAIANNDDAGKLPLLNELSTEGSPVRQIERTNHDIVETVTDPKYRTFDGSGNNILDASIGKAGNPLLRKFPVDYADRISQLAGPDRQSARAISNIVNAQSESIPNDRYITDFLWQWGQFLDHDIDLTDGTVPEEYENIPVPVGDIYFDPDNTGIETIIFNRSIYDTSSGTSIDNPRQQINEVTSWIDASNVYGSDSERASALRVLDGSGRMKVSAGDFLPYNTDGLSNAGGDSDSLFIAGDVRANEQVGLTALHTLFVREHNRIADIIAAKNSTLSGDEIYFRARKLVGAEMQHITYHEYLPLLLGRGALSKYKGYRPGRNGEIRNLFSTGPYRYGHSALNSNLLRIDMNGETIVEGNLALRDAFFAPERLTSEGGLEPVLLGLSRQLCQDIDPFVIDDVRNFLFGNPGEGGFDLASLNIQRGRDHGLASYNKTRLHLGLAKKNSFAEISSNPEIQHRLATAYDSVDDIDVWVGGLAEDHHADAFVGELIATVLTRQFEVLRDGDRFWYERDLNQRELRMVKSLRLADIIRLNTDIDDEISNNVFRYRK